MILSIAGWLSGLVADVPVDPDGDQARRWILEELAKPEYQAAKPTWWDIVSKAFWDWLTSLLDFSGLGAFQAPLLVLLIVIVAAAIVVAFLAFGRPRRNRRGSGAGALFGEDETRTSDQLRAAAERAASDGDWTLAIEELFRSLARSLDERVLVPTLPGTTANGFARMAGAVFPEHATRLRAGGAAFDGVRYLGSPGSEAEYLALLALDDELRAARPAMAEAAE
jgi:hypothetical protein